MVQMSCQCCLLVVATVLLAVRPTLELFVGASREQVSEERAEDPEREGEAAVYQEGLVYRPNERDKPHQQKLRHHRSAGSERSDSFVFPDQVPTASIKLDPELEDRLFVVPNTAAPPPCAQGDTFCESVDEYPAEHVIRLLKKEPVFVKRFFQDDRRQYTLSDDNVEDRIDTSDETPLCVAQEQIVYPKMAKNIEGNWLFVINQDEYKQGVRVEKCVRSDHECWFPASLPIGYRSQCKQKYIYRKLVALNGTGQGVITDSFPLPSCCSCIIKLDRNLAHNRFGGALPLTLPKTTPTPPPHLGKSKS